MIAAILLRATANRQDRNRHSPPTFTSTSRSPATTASSMVVAVFTLIALSLWLVVNVNIWSAATQWETVHFDRHGRIMSGQRHTPIEKTHQGGILQEVNSDTNMEYAYAHAWQNTYDLVHVVQTRFMQHQAHLQNLGRARMQLFRTITLPSMMQQSSREFLWLIRIDPNLSLELKNDFMDVMDMEARLVVILSNENIDGFRDDGMSDIRSQAQVLGRTLDAQRLQMEKVKTYYQAAQTRIVLETRLDADDALASDMVDSIQRQAFDELSQRKSDNQASDYRVWCIGMHMEWQFYNPLDVNSTIGSLVAFPYNHCVTPGLTFGYQIEAQSSHVPTHKHDKIHKLIPKCGYRRTHQCLSVSTRSNGDPLALRARTPTSAGMMNILTPNNDNGKSKTQPQMETWNRLQTQAWNKVEKLFGITQSSVAKMRQELNANLSSIVADNALGQCTPGHSCKPSSKAILAKFQRDANH